MYRKFSADRIFTGEEMIDIPMVLITDASGVVKDIVSPDVAGSDAEYIGPGKILSPGLINAHCHLELSHLRGIIPPHTGLIDFLLGVVSNREFNRSGMAAAIAAADQEMLNNGIVAVGDISNTTDSLPVKQQSGISWVNFIEVLSFTDENASDTINAYEQVLNEFRQAEYTHPYNQKGKNSQLVPHAPYTVSPQSFRIINESTAGRVVSIHNQEHPAEDELYQSGGGDYLRLFRFFGKDRSPFPVTGKTSLRSVLPHFNNDQQLLLVHNTYMPEQDLAFAMEYSNNYGVNLYFCLCPNANLYIENRLPPVQMFRKAGAAIVLGTDSYSSNFQLDIMQEIKVLRNSLPEIPYTELLTWATMNGARALKIDDRYGSFTTGKQPGIVSIDDNYKASRLL